MTAVGRVDAEVADEGPHAGKDRYERATTVIVQASVLLAGLDVRLPGNISATLLIALALLPMWATAIRAYSLAPLVFALVGASVVNGLVLSQISSIDHTIERSSQIHEVAMFLSSVGALGLLLWARQRLPFADVVVLFGTGLLLDSVASAPLSWKFGLAVPMTLIIVGLVEREQRRALAAAVIVGLGLLGVVDGGRSYFGMCLLAATLTLWQVRQSSTSRRSTKWFPAMLLLGLGVGLYYLASALLTGGYLGVEVQQRSVEQIETTGSLLAGGRPEWAATRELVKLQPSGYGVGVTPSWRDVTAGKRGLASINVEAGGYADHYMFGGRFRLHSVTADLWVSYGLAGLALAVTIMVALVRSLSFAMAERAATTSVCFIVVLSLWYMLFGPIISNWLEVCGALGLALLPRGSPGPGVPSDPRPARGW